MTNEYVVTATRAFVVESFLYASPDYVVGADDSLLDRGIIDSMGVIELVDFVHTTFGVDVDDDEITEENLGCLSAIARFVVAKQRDLIENQDAA